MKIIHHINYRVESGLPNNFIEDIAEYEEYVGSAPIIKTFLNLILASTLLPVQLFLRKYLKGKEKKQEGVEDELV